VPTTWDEFTAACETLKGAGVIPLYATIDGRWPAFIWFEEFLIRNDPDFYVELCEGRAKYTDPTAVKALEDWKALIDAEYFTELDIPMDSNFTGMFANGEVGMIQIGTWFQQQFIAAEMVPGEDYDAFILPNINPELTRNVMVIESGAVVIPADGKNLDASQQAAAWWMQKDAQTKWSTLLGDAPFNPNVTSENPVINGLVKTVGEEKYELLQRYWEASPPAIVENAVDELARFMLNPGEAQSVLEAIQKIADEEWSKRKGA
jgi:ABC-type glycerol-3-phosphate transport system substrate-binding protein